MKKKTEVDTFLELWNESNKKSFISGKDLREYINSEFIWSCFAHVIPKNGMSTLVFPNKKVKDELLRHNKENIVLLTPHEHFLIDQGTEKGRKQYEEECNCSFDKFYKLKERLIEEIKQKIKSWT